MGAQAARANFDALWTAVENQLCPLDIGLEPPVSMPVGVAYILPRVGSSIADSAAGHGYTLKEK